MPDGSKSNPWLVETYEDLKNVGRGEAGTPYEGWDLDSHYKQIADIDASASETENNGDGWEPISQGTPYFSGSYNGDNHEITGLFIDRIGQGNNISMFGRIANDTLIRNMRIIDCDITGSHQVAALVSDGRGSPRSTVINCHVTGKLDSGGNSTPIGGVVARGGSSTADGIIIIQCTANVAILQGQSRSGGIIGQAFASYVSKCSAYGEIDAPGTIAVPGGLVGAISSRGETVIIDSYAQVDITVSVSFVSAGGFVGEGDSNATVKNCYSTGLVHGATGDDIQGFIGDMDGINFENNYYDEDTSGHSQDEATTGAAPRTTAQMLAGTPGAVLDTNGVPDPQGDPMYVNWSLDTWDYPENEYPELADIRVYIAIGGATAEDRLSIFRWYGQLSKIVGINTGAATYGVEWSPDGNYIALCGARNTTGERRMVDVWEFDRSDETLARLAFHDPLGGQTCWKLSWHPDGTHFAVAHDSDATKNVTIYSWDGTNLSAVETFHAGGSGTAWRVRWSPSGDFIGVGHADGTRFTLLNWDSVDEEVSIADTFSFGNPVYSIAWTSDENYIALGSGGSPRWLTLLEWDGSNLTLLDDGIRAETHWSVDFDDNDRYLTTSTSTRTIVYELDEQNETLVLQDLIEDLTFAWEGRWKPGSDPLYSQAFSGGFVRVYEFVDGDIAQASQVSTGTLNSVDWQIDDIEPPPAVIDLSGDIETQTTVAGDLSVTKSLSGTVAAESVIDGDLTVEVAAIELSGDIGAESHVAGDLTVSKLLSGATAAEANLAGDLTISKVLSGEVATDSDVTAEVAIRRNLSGTVTAESEVAGDISIARSVSGSIEAESVASGNVILALSLSGSIDAESTITHIDTLRGSINAESAVEGALSVAKTLSASIDAESDLQANIFVVVPLSGDIEAASTLDANLAVLKSLESEIEANSTVTGDVSITKTLSGELDATSQASGDVAIRVSLSGTIEAESSVRETPDMVGQISAVSVVDGSLSVEKTLSGDIDAESDISGELLVLLDVEISGTIDAESAIAGDISAKVGLAGDIHAESAIAADVSLDISLSGTIAAESEVIHIEIFQGTIRAESTVTAELAVMRSLSVTVAAESDLDGDLARRVGLSGTVAANSEVAGLFVGVFVFSGTVAAESEVSGDFIIREIIGEICLDAIFELDISLDASIPGPCPRHMLQQLSGNVAATSS